MSAFTERRQHRYGEGCNDAVTSRRMPSVAPALLPPQTFTVTVPADRAEALRQFVAALGGEVCE